MTKLQISLFSSAILAAVLLGAFAITQAAYANVNQDGPHDDYRDYHSGIEISVSGHAMVMNTAETKADTGDNYAGGSVGGDGGNGGDVENEYGSQDVEGATTGNGGAGGNSGLGGLVQTGNATAETSIANVVGSTTIGIDDCACDGTTIGKVRIRTHDFAFLKNRVQTKADTGDNRAKGSYAGDGGNGGDIENEGGLEEDNDDSDQEVDDSTTGSGGNGGTSSTGGTVMTGAADARTEIMNSANQTRINIRG